MNIWTRQNSRGSDVGVSFCDITRYRKKRPRPNDDLVDIAADDPGASGSGGSAGSSGEPYTEPYTPKLTPAGSRRYRDLEYIQ